MKALKIIGIVVLILAVVGGISYFAFALGKAQTNTANNNSSNNSGNNVTPKVVTDPTCNADELALSIAESSEGGAGTLALSLVFTNTGSRECQLYGYPGLSLVNANGNQVGSPADRMTGVVEAKVTLKSGESTQATVTYPEEGNFDAGTCKDGAVKLRVYPPNDYGYLSIASPITGWCPGLKVGPVTAE